LDVEVSVVVDRAAVGGGEDAFLPVFRRNTEIRALFDNRVVAEFAENFKILVEQDSAAGEFSDEDLKREAERLIAENASKMAKVSVPMIEVEPKIPYEPAE
jgi:hypothetical protein